MKLSFSHVAIGGWLLALC